MFCRGGSRLSSSSACCCSIGCWCCWLCVVVGGSSGRGCAWVDENVVVVNRIIHQIHFRILRWSVVISSSVGLWGILVGSIGSFPNIRLVGRWGTIGCRISSRLRRSRRIGVFGRQIVGIFCRCLGGRRVRIFPQVRPNRKTSSLSKEGCDLSSLRGGRCSSDPALVHAFRVKRDAVSTGPTSLAAGANFTSSGIGNSAAA